MVEVAVDKPQSGDLGARRQKPRPSVTEITNKISCLAIALRRSAITRSIWSQNTGNAVNNIIQHVSLVRSVNIVHCSYQRKNTLLSKPSDQKMTDIIITCLGV